MAHGALRRPHKRGHRIPGLEGLDTVARIAFASGVAFFLKQS